MTDTAGSTRRRRPEPWSDLPRCGAAGALAVALLLVLEPLWSTGGLVPSIIALGAVLGFLGSAGFALLHRRPRLAAMTSIAACVLAGLALLLALGVPARLDGKDAALAWSALVSIILASVAAGVILATAPRIPSTPRRARVAAGAAFLLVAGLTVGDHTLFPTTYADFHLALQVATVCVAALGGIWLMATRGVVGSAESTEPAQRRAIVKHWRLAAIAGLALAGWAWPEAPLEDAIRRPLAGLVVDAGRRLTDFDADGYSHLLDGGDCDPWDDAIGPGATEIPGNGIDENCVGGDGAAITAASAESVPIPTEAAPVSVVLITIDALRPDRMSIYGAERPTTPNLARHFPEPRHRHPAMYTAGGFTSISIPAMMRGVLPRRIHWTPVVQTNHLRLSRRDDPLELRPGERLVYQYGLPLDDPHRPLAWWLARRGMATAAVVDDGPSKFLEARWGTGEGFRDFVEIPGDQDDDARVADEAIALLDGLVDGPPFFLWTHFYGPHLPDDRHPATPDFGDDPLARYDHEIAFVDTQVGRLLDALAQRPGPRPVAVFVTSDHGEMIWGPGRMRSHGRLLHPHAIRVPLLHRIIGRGGKSEASMPRTGGIHSTVDLMPTILELTRTPAPPGLDGIPMNRARSIALTETWFWESDGQMGLDLIGALDDETLLVVDRLRNVAGVYERTDDALPPTNRAGEQKPAALIEAISAHIDRSGGPPLLRLGRP